MPSMLAPPPGSGRRAVRGTGRSRSRLVGVRVVVLGATGTAGRGLVPLLLGAGHAVLAPVRSDAAEAVARSVGAATARGDADDPATLARWLGDADVAVDLRVAVPAGKRALRPGGWRDYTDLRDRATGRLVDAAIATGTRRVVRDTITMVYADGGERLLVESAAVEAPGAMRANLDAEAHVARLTAAGGEGVALRLAPFYGPHDSASSDLLARARRGQALVLAPAAAWTSALHTDDVGPALAVAVMAPAVTGVWNVSDDDPLRAAELVEVLAGAVGRDGLRTPPRALLRLAPAPVRALGRSQRVTSAAFRTATGWRPGVPSRRQGWPAAAG